VVNLGNPEEYTIAQLAQIVSEILGVPLNVDNHPSREDDPTRRKPDIGVARELLEWEPKITCNDGLRRTIEYFRGG
jgi:nucleoside-diphosphate-sugar epimerase